MGPQEDKVTTGQDGARSSKQDWIRLAIEALVADGIDQVKVQVLAKKLGVSRSSFYWFFDSLQDLLDELLAYWLKKNTGPIIERAMRPAGSINTAVCNVFECWIDDTIFDPNLDTAVRIWGRRDPTVRAVVDEADTQRVEAVKRMFMRHGFEEEEAFTRARVLYFTQVGHFTLELTDSISTRMSHLRSYLLTFTGIEPTESDVKHYKAFVSRLEKKVVAAERM